jgi:hypothetical protein
MNEIFGPVIFYGFLAWAIFMFMFRPKQYKEINDMMYDNVRRTSGGLAKAGKVGFFLFRIFTRK